MSSIKDGEIIGIIVENKHINGLQINLVITIDRGPQQKLNKENPWLNLVINAVIPFPIYSS